MSQFQIPPALKAALQQGKLIPFVGAGVSMSVLKKDAVSPTDSLFPSWGNLLRNGAEKVETNQKAFINATLDLDEDDCYLEAAKKLKQYLGNNKWNVFLKEQLEFKKSSCDLSSLITAKNIWLLNCPLIITTNYDKVLDWSCPQQKLDDLQHWDIEATFEQADSLRNPITTPTVWQLHGRIANVNDIILTPGGYDNLYNENETQYKAALTTLQTKLSTNPFLFIGFSFNDDVFVNQLKKINNVFDGNNAEHFVLIKKSQEQAIKDLDLNLTTITYEQHSELPQLLEYIASTNEVKADEKPLLPALSNIHNGEPIDNTFNPNNTVFNVPFRQKGAGVVGRELVLLELRELLEEGAQTNIGHAASFRGMGGLGKTQLAVEYAYRYKEEYSNGIMWLSADQDIPNQLLAMATKAKWFSPHLEAAELLEKTIYKLKNTNDCLIIFDNVEDYQQIASYLPNAEVTPHLLLTSRIDINGFKVLPLELLTETDAIKLLLKEANKERESITEADYKICQHIVDVLGCLPLAIELAGSYLQKRQTVSFSQYQTLLENSLRNTLNHQHLASFTKNQKGLLATLTLTEQEIEQAPLIKDILRLLSWSSSASMGTSLMAALLDVDEVELIEPLALGVELRLLASTDDNRFNIHRLLKEIQKELNPISSNEQWHQQICKIIVTWFSDKKDDFLQLSTYQAELDHLETWTQLSEQYNWPDSAGLLWLQAYPLWHLGHYKLVETILNKAFQLMTAESDEHLKAHILGDLGAINYSLGMYDKALAYIQQSLNIRQVVLDGKHPDIAKSYSNIGSTYDELQQHDKALEHKEKSLKIRLAMLGGNHPDTAASYNNIGSTYALLQQYNKALEYQEKALKILLEVLGGNHPDTAKIYNNIGSTYSHLGEHNKALEHKEKALNINLRFLGENHPVTAVIYNNIGGSYSHLGKHNKALEHEEKALEIRLAVLGENHPDTASIFDHVGCSYCKLQQYNKALEYQEKALKIRLAVLGESHPDTANSYNNIGMSYYHFRQYKYAIEHFKFSLTFYLNTSEAVNVSKLKTIVKNLIESYISLNQFDIARSEVYELRKHPALKCGVNPWLDDLSTDIDDAAKSKGFRVKSNTTASKKKNKGSKRK